MKTVTLFILVFIIIIYIRYFIPLRLKEKGSKYVHVKNDGSVRELSKDEEKYLEEEFDPCDGARPYTK